MGGKLAFILAEQTPTCVSGCMVAGFESVKKADLNDKLLFLFTNLLQACFYPSEFKGRSTDTQRGPSHTTKLKMPKIFGENTGRNGDENSLNSISYDRHKIELRASALMANTEGTTVTRDRWELWSIDSNTPDFFFVKHGIINDQ